MVKANGSVVLIHSSASSGRQWRALSERLPDGYQVIAPDLCGYAPDDGEAGEYGYEDDCDRVRRVMAAARSPVHLIGHSYGGLLSIVTALEQPDHLRSLTLIEPVCFHLLKEAGETQAYEEIKAVSERQVAAADSGDLMASAQGFVSYWMGARTWQGMPEDRRAMVAAAMPKVAREWPGSFHATTRLADYASLPRDTLIVRAADTTLAARTVVDLLKERLSERNVAEIAHGGHMSPVTNGEAVNTAITSFLAGLSPSG